MSKALLVTILLLLFAGTCMAQAEDHKADQAIEVGKERITEGQSAQEQIDTISSETEVIVADFTGVLKIVDSLEVYKRLLQKQLDGQDREISALKDSISNVTVIERQIAPLLSRMIDDLGRFIQLDMPFLLQERQARVNKLGQLMERADLTLAEKTRRVFEAFQIENDYGRTIEGYKGQLTIEDDIFDVEFLRVGRIALVYRDISGKRSGTWNLAENNWQPVTGSNYRRHLTRALKIARQEMAPELLTMPLIVNKEVR